jgi:hypothetical protein
MEKKMTKVEISSETGTVPWSIKLDGREVAEDVRRMWVNIGEGSEPTTVTLEFCAFDGLVADLGDVVVWATMEDES